MNNEQLNNNVINNGTTPNTPQNGNNTLNMNSTQYVNNPEQVQRNNVNNDKKIVVKLKFSNATSNSIITAIFIIFSILFFIYSPIISIWYLFF